MRLLTLLFLLATLPLSAQSPDPFTVYFDSDQAALRPDARATLDRITDRIAGLPDYRLTLAAHTDDQGAEGYNLDLARRRAQRVVDYLAERNVIVDKIETAHYGESQPAQPNDTETGRQANRRVDLRLTPVALPTLSELLRQLRPGEQRYTIDPNQPTRLVGRNGTHCWIEAGSFTFADGTSPTGPVEIALREAYDPADMLLNGLSTVADGRPLQTGGMIYLAAEADGQPLQLAENANVLVGMPTEMMQENMQLFTGQANPDGGVTNWQPTGQPARPSLEDFIDMPPPPEMPALVLHKQPIHLEYPPEPKTPAPPRAPFVPHKPERENVRYNPGFLQTLLQGKKNVEAKEEAIFEKHLEQYERRLARYQHDSAAHELALLRYQDQLAAHREAVDAWKAEKREIDAYRDRLQYAAEAGQRAAYQLEYEAYLEEFRTWKDERVRRVEAYYEEYLPAGEAGARLLQGYIFQVNELGWINCDRFWNVPDEEKALLAVTDDDAHEEIIYVHFREDDSLLRADRQAGRYVTAGIPASAQVRIIGIKLIDGRPHLAVHETRVDAAAEYALKYEAVSVREIRRVLSVI